MNLSSKTLCTQKSFNSEKQYLCQTSKVTNEVRNQDTPNFFFVEQRMNKLNKITVMFQGYEIHYKWSYQKRKSLKNDDNPDLTRVS